MKRETEANGCVLGAVPETPWRSEKINTTQIIDCQQQTGKE